MMTSAQVVEMSATVTDNSPFQDYPHPDDHTIRSTVTPGLKPFTVFKFVLLFYNAESFATITAVKCIVDCSRTGFFVG